MDPKVIELAKLDMLESNAWEGWRRSQEDGEDGDLGYLQAVGNCMDCRARMLALYPPRKIEYTVRHMDGPRWLVPNRYAEGVGGADAGLRVPCRATAGVSV